MFLHRLHLNLRSRDVRRDLADPYQMHATLCRAFSPSEEKCPPGTFLWRLEPESGPGGSARILVQSSVPAKWERILVRDWLAEEIAPSVDLSLRLKLGELKAGQRFRFRLSANPSITMAGKRVGLLDRRAQEDWLERKGSDQHGFLIPRVETFDPFPSEPQPPVPQIEVNQEHMIRSHQQNGNGISVFAVRFDGLLEVTDPGRFRGALAKGIGHGKALGLGLLSLAPIR
jgi:CRISPR system Cascade subunit CasE